MSNEIRTVVAGFDASPESKDGLRLAATITSAVHAELIVATALEYDPAPMIPVEPYEEARQAEFTEIFREAGDLLGATPFGRRGLSGRPPRALAECAVREEADMIVLGSTHQRRLGRVYPGSVAHHLSHGAPCPLAVASRGYDSTDFRTIGVAFDGRDASRPALRFALALAEAGGARLKVACVLPTHMVVAGEMLRDTEMRARIETRLQEGLAEISADDRAEIALLEYGDGPAPTLADAAAGFDLLVVGSRGHGPVGRVLLGTVAGQLLRSAPTPVIVVPRAAPAGVSAGASDLSMNAG